MSKRKDGGAITRIKALAQDRDIPVQYISKHVLNMLSDQRPHQGVVADCGDLAYEPIHVLPDAAEAMATAKDGVPPVWLAFDQVSDPVCPLHRHVFPALVPV